MCGINNHKEPTHWCQTCLNHFSNKNALLEHKKMNCGDLGKGQIRLPPVGGDNSICRFRNAKAT